MAVQGFPAALRVLGACAAWVLLLAGLAYAPRAESARILAILPFNGYSHYIMFEPLLKELAARGHQVTELSPFYSEKPAQNYRWISLQGAAKQVQGAFSPQDLYLRNPLHSMSLIAGTSDEMCEGAIVHPNVQALLRSREQFDLVISEVFGTDCLLGFVHKFRAPLVSMSTHVLTPWALDRMGVPSELAYVPSFFTGASDDMSFLERLSNTLVHFAGMLHFEYLESGRRDALVRPHFGADMPPLRELAGRTSLMLVNTHFSMFSARPSIPGVVEVGGIHIKPPKPLPPELREYLDSSPHGVVYFSMGSILRGASLSNQTVRSLVTAFSRLDENVLWKWEHAETSPPPGLPPNVRVQSWLPQADLLAHPKVRAFLSHSGLMSATEAVYAGVPMVAVPMFSDQPHNAAMLQARGMAVRLDFPDLDDADKVFLALRRVLDDPHFLQSARRTSAAFRDRPMPPLQTAVWWTEYVARHGGARFLQTRAATLSWLRRANADVLLLLLLALLALLLLLLTAAVLVADVLTICWRKAVSRKPKMD